METVVVKVVGRLVCSIIVVSIVLFGSFGRTAHASTITVDDRAGVLGNGRARIEAAAAKVHFPLAVYTRQSFAAQDEVAALFRSRAGLADDTLIYVFDVQQQTLYSGSPIEASASTADILAEIDAATIKQGQNVADVIAGELDSYSQLISRNQSPQSSLLEFALSLMHGWGVYVVLGVLAFLVGLAIYMRIMYGRSLRFGLFMLLIEGMAWLLSRIRQRFFPDQPRPLPVSAWPQSPTTAAPFVAVPPVSTPAPPPPILPTTMAVAAPVRASMVTDEDWQALHGHYAANFACRN